MDDGFVITVYIMKELLKIIETIIFLNICDEELQVVRMNNEEDVEFGQRVFLPNSGTFFNRIFYERFLYRGFLQESSKFFKNLRRSRQKKTCAPLDQNDDYNYLSDDESGGGQLVSIVCEKPVVTRQPTKRSSIISHHAESHQVLYKNEKSITSVSTYNDPPVIFNHDDQHLPLDRLVVEWNDQNMDQEDQDDQETTEETELLIELGNVQRQMTAFEKLLICARIVTISSNCRLYLIMIDEPINEHWTPRSLFNQIILDNMYRDMKCIGHPYYWHPIVHKKTNRVLRSVIKIYKTLRRRERKAEELREKAMKVKILEQHTDDGGDSTTSNSNNNHPNPNLDTSCGNCKNVNLIEQNNNNTTTAAASAEDSASLALESSDESADFIFRNNCDFDDNNNVVVSCNCDLDLEEVIVHLSE